MCAVGEIVEPAGFERGGEDGGASGSASACAAAPALLAAPVHCVEEMKRKHDVVVPGQKKFVSCALPAVLAQSPRDESTGERAGYVAGDGSADTHEAATGPGAAATWQKRVLLHTYTVADVLDIASGAAELEITNPAAFGTSVFATSTLCGRIVFLSEYLNRWQLSARAACRRLVCI